MERNLDRLRLTFAKTEAMRFTGHLDLHRTWERAFRRAKLPLAYRQGFNPQPRFSLACALPLGITSTCEMLDVWFDQPVTPAELEDQLVPALPPGLEIVDIWKIDVSEPALQTQVVSATYSISVADPAPDLAEKCQNFLAMPSAIRQWKGKEYDLRPLIIDLRLKHNETNNTQEIEVILQAREGATGRPEEVVAALGLSPDQARIVRTNLTLSAGEIQPGE